MGKEKVEPTGRTSHAKGTTKHAGGKASPGTRSSLEKAQEKEQEGKETRH